ncbi:hypothetical protein BUALT_Bualt01G0013400 [Buddleja alternifolia]|uniref:Histone-lysine N-methyltransferase ASHH2 n=1 Tax=Buddleja alternifolia TaxID=168488 RepID=A0AAV6Y5T3_9LAMI|nr:hypothetical protein BUALT_Bualt01G0013400 [Buddleja alternifolia]
MDVYKQSSMFTETSFDENVSEIKEESTVDLDFVIGKLSVSTVPYESSCMRADESSASMVTPDISGADVLLSALESISFAEHPEHRGELAKNSIEADGYATIGEGYPPGQRPDEGKDTSELDSPALATAAEPSAQNDIEADQSGQSPDEGKDTSELDSPDIATVAEPSAQKDIEADQSGQSPDEGKDTSKLDSPDLDTVPEPSTLRNGEAEVGGEIDVSCKPNHPLIVYTSSRRSARNTNSNPNKESQKPSRNRRTATKKNSVLDINSLQISRRRRSSFSKRARSSDWGFLGSILPDFEAHSGLDLNLGNEVKPVKVKGVQRNRKAIKDQKGRKSVRKTCTPTGPISLKIKFGNKSCGVSDVTDKFNASGKNISGLFDSTENKLKGEVLGNMVLPLEGNFEKLMSSDASVLDTLENSCFNSLTDHHQMIIKEEGDNMRVSIENRCSDPGTSPDSEVINSVPDASLLEKGLQNMQGSPVTSKACVSFGDVSSLGFMGMNSKKGKKKNKHHQLGDCSVEIKLTGAETTNIAKVTDTLIPCSNGQKFPKCSRAKGGGKSRSGVLDLPSKKDKASKKKGNKSNLVVKHQINEKGDANDVLTGVEIHIAAGNQTSSYLEGAGDLSKTASGPINSLQVSSGGLTDQYVPPRNAWVLCDECQKWRRIPAKLADLIEETNSGWTCKNNTDKDFAACSIPQEKSNSEINKELEISDDEDAREVLLKSNQIKPKDAQQSSWSLIRSNLFLHRSRKNQSIDEVMVCHCKPSSDGRMGCGAKCLNRMLNIECVKKTCPCGELCSNQQFQKRKYAKLKSFKCGKKGFGLQSLENIFEGQFLIEYVGEVLDMHAYEARQREYALKGHKHFYFMTLNGSEVIDACAKGNLGRFINHSCDPNCRTEKWMVNGEVCVGLFAIRDIKKGEEVTFDYNYVRVFGAAAKKCVCGSSNCRGYIGGDVTNSEVIVQEDSDDEYSEPVMTCEDREMNEDWNDIMSNKDSLNGRENKFTNKTPESRHRMKKLVNAVCQFQGINSEILPPKVEGASCVSTDECLKTLTATQVTDEVVQDRFDADSSVHNDSVSSAVVQLDINKNTGESLGNLTSAAFKVEPESVVAQMHSSVQLLDISLNSGGIMDKTISASESEMTASTLSNKSRSDAVESKINLKHDIVGGNEELAKSTSLSKTHRSSSSIKKGKLKSKVVNEGTPNVDKSNAATQKSKKLPDLSLNSHVETVEEKLNELLDTEGGISKRKDASRGYLKLLFLTAASGNNGHGEAIQSNRDLSMILDALLKTKSRTVLVDIISKNGLQMLHNILKRYRKEFIKTPILRKLLKVLEYLAMREILTLEHITGGPPCPGVESFKDSILTLTEHDDKQVHQIARNFRDRFIPRSLRKNCCMEIDNGRIEFHQRSGYGRSSVSYDQWNDRFGKPSEPNDSESRPVVASGAVETSTLDPSPTSVSTSGTHGTRTRKRKSRWDNPAEDNDIPPGFSSPCIASTVPAVSSSTVPNHQERNTLHPFDVVLGDSQQRFVSHIPLSYGIPSSVMQQFGSCQGESAVGWSIAPGFTFHPFPPLPLTSAAKSLSSEPAEKAEQGTSFVAQGQKRKITWNGDTQEINAPFVNDAPGGSSSHGLDRKYFRQQKWNHPKLAPPWVRMRNGWGHNSYNSEEVNWRGEF